MLKNKRFVDEFKNAVPEGSIENANKRQSPHGNFITSIRPCPIGFDCETVGKKNPRVKLLAYSGVFDFETKQFKFIQSQHGQHADLPYYIENPSLEQMLDFLYSHVPANHHDNRKNCFGVFYNERYDFSVIIKNALRDPELARQYLAKEPVEIGEYRVRYLKNKCFSIAKKKEYELDKETGKWIWIEPDLRKFGKPRLFYDTANFYKVDNHTISLDKAARDYLNEGKLSDVDRTKLGSENGDKYYAENRDRIIEYCIRDCQLTARLHNLTVDSQTALYEKLFNKSGLYPRFWYSTGSLAKAWLELEHAHLKYLGYLLPRHEQDFVQHAYYGGFTAIWKIGRFQRVSIVDINSGYPFAMSQAVSPIELGALWTKEYHKDAAYGIYKVQANWNRLFPARVANSLLYPSSNDPVSTVRYVGKQALEYLWQRGDSVKIIEGLEFFSPSGGLEFLDIESMYNERLRQKKLIKFKGDIHDILMGLKLLLNSGYGTFCQMEHATVFTNPLIGQFITEATRVRIWKLIDLVGIDNVIFASTDCIAYIDNGQLDTYLERFDDKLGSLDKRLNRGEIVVYKSGVYLQRSCDCRSDSKCLKLSEEQVKLDVKDNPHWTLKRRGYVSITPNMVLKAKGSKLVVKENHVWTIDEVLEENAYRLRHGQRLITDKIGKFEVMTRTLDLTTINEKAYVNEEFLDFQNLNREGFDVEPFDPLNPELRKEKFGKVSDDYIKRKLRFAPDFTCFENWESRLPELIKNYPKLNKQTFVERKLSPARVLSPEEIMALQARTKEVLSTIKTKVKKKNV